MMIRNLFSIINLLFVLVQLNAQDNILLRVNDREVSADEFKWLYNKNNQGEQYSDIDEYLDLYINLRLKVEAAEEAGIHKSEAFKSELNGYRKQLAKDYLTDNEAKEEFIRKAYERYKTEINAYHVLIKCPVDASPEDSLKAYDKAMNIRQRIILGEPFESVAKGASDDPNVNLNGGNLGYFTVFQTPLSFEDAVYNMEPGELSMPVRTAGGYHIIKVQDKRRNQGRIKVAHIMKSTPPGSTEQIRKKAKNKIDSLYQLLEQGADFDQLAKENSDDKVSSQSGGELPWFGSGEMIHEFSNAAFSLLRNNEYTKPIKTVYGWHIIKRIDKQPFPSFEDARKYLESRLSFSYLQSLSQKSFAEKLKKEYEYELNKRILEWFYAVADSSFRYSNKHMIPERPPEGVLYSFAGEECTAQGFAEYIEKNGNQAPVKDSLAFINSLLEQKVYSHLINYEDAHLEDKYPEFRYLMNEFYDGILFFEITDSLIWKKSLNDSIGLSNYYESRKADFMKQAEMTARLYKISPEAGRRKMRRIIRSVKRYHDKEEGNDKIIAESIKGRDTLVSISTVQWKRNDNDLTDRIKWNKGIQQIRSENGMILVDVLEIKEAQYMELEEVKGTIINDYQKYLEEKWLNELRSKYGVLINNDILNTIKSEMDK